jgi:NitT/TauT family transport system permease protein
MMATLREKAPGLAAVLIFVLAWEAYCRTSGISALLLPAPSGVAVALWDLVGEAATWRHFAITLGETLAGFVLAVAFGLALGTAVARSRMLERAVQPFIVASQVVPKVALVPLFVLWFGFGPTSKIVVAAVIAFFPVLTNTLLGMRSVEAGHRDVFRAARAGPLQRFWLLELPAALPAILAGTEMAIVLATIGAVVGEFLGGSSGLGYLAVATMNAFQTDRLFGIIVLLALMGSALHGCMVAMRRALIPWHESGAR